MAKISIVIPTFNESKNIPVLIEKLNVCLAHIDKEVIIVDDNSPDKTWDVARHLSHTYSWLRVIRRMHDRGLSSAVLAGFAVAEGDYLAVMDADLQHDESILPQFLEALQNGASIVVGSRKVDGGKTENWSLMRQFISFVATLMAKIALRHPVSDPMSGFFAMRFNIYQNYKDDINPKGFKILLEFLARAKNVEIKEIGYTFKSRIHGESKLSSKIIVEYLKTLYELSLGKYIPMRFLKYSCVGLSGLFVSQCVLFLCLKYFNLPDTTSVNISIELSILTNFFLNNHWTFRENKLLPIKPILKGLITFHAICLSGAMINQAVALKFASIFSMNLYFGNALGYSIAAVWNYVINVGVTWRAK